MNNYGVTLKFGNHFQTTNVLALKLKQPKTIAQNLEIVQGQQYLLLAAHLALNSLLYLTAITPYQLVFLDKKQKFTGASFSFSNPAKLFSIQGTLLFVLFVPFAQLLKVISPRNFQFALQHQL
jgi:hypothetical protein